MPKDISEISHEGDEYFDSDGKFNRTTVKETEEFIRKIDRTLSRQQRKILQKEWLSPDNPFIWDPIIDLD